MFYVLFFLSYAVLCIYMVKFTGSYLYAMLGWNTVLAFIPYALVKLAIKRGNSKYIKAVLFLTALFFWPNSIYLVTDFIHLGGDVFYTRELYQSAVYVQDIGIWLKLLTIAVGMFFGVFMSFCALKKFLDYMKFKGVGRYSAAFLLSAVGSVGVYIGRFIRLNSWDMLNPFRVLKMFMENINDFGIMYIISFTIFTFSVFVIFEYIVGREV